MKLLHPTTVFEVSLGQIVAGGILAYLAYAVSLVVYRLYFSPLARFPGPKIAAATGWYEFYYQCLRDGKYIFEIEKMHEKYGPIVRVTPEELSINDPEFYNELYVTANVRRTEHYDNFGRGIGLDHSHLFTVNHELHRIRRKPLEHFFSRLGVTRLQGLLAEVTLHFETRLREFSGTGKPIRLDFALSAYTGDIIGRMVLDTPNKEDLLLSDPDFSVDWSEVILGIIKSIPLFMAFPWIVQTLKYIPENVLLWIYPKGQAFNHLKLRARDQVRKAMAADEKDEDVTSLFHYVAKCDMPEAEKDEERLVMEAALLLTGGTFTSSRTIGCAAYYILSRPELKAKIEAEVEETMAGWPEQVPKWADLEKLPLLQAVIKESLRISYGVMHRLPRIAPDVALQYKDYVIPPGVPVGMSAYFMHNDPSVFPNPTEFIPERWLGETDSAMYRNYVPFARGSRNCLGLNLAMAEISLGLAVLFRPSAPQMELYETDESDVKLIHDYAVALPKLDTKGIRVTVR